MMLFGVKKEEAKRKEGERGCQASPRKVGCQAGSKNIWLQAISAARRTHITK